jgi:hypothetical protein
MAARVEIGDLQGVLCSTAVTALSSSTSCQRRTLQSAIARTTTLRLTRGTVLEDRIKLTRLSFYLSLVVQQIISRSTNKPDIILGANINRVK